MSKKLNQALAKCGVSVQVTFDEEGNLEATLMRSAFPLKFVKKDGSLGEVVCKISGIALNKAYSALLVHVTGKQVGVGENKGDGYFRVTMPEDLHRLLD